MPFPPITPTIPDLLRSARDRFGERVFLVADEEVTYGDLETRSRRLAKGLLRHGVGKGSHVGIWMPNSVAWAEAWFALGRIGAVAVPLNTFLRTPELAWTVRHADLSTILTVAAFKGHDYLDRLEDALPGLAQAHPATLMVKEAPYLRSVVVWGDQLRAWCTAGAEALAQLGDSVDDDHLRELETCVSPADRLAIIYTSGSTGEPKGTIHTHGSLVRHSFNLTHIYPVGSDDVLFTSMPFFWVGGLITGLHAVIHHGATLVTQAAFDAGDALDRIEQHQATITLGWPQQGKSIADHPSFPSRDLTSVRRTSMPAMVPEDRRPPPNGAGSLGMTEMCGNHLGVDPYLPQPPSRAGTFGPSIDGLEHRIVDPDTGRECQRGLDGEIWVRGYSLMQGIYKREREETFTPDGFYRTGDGGAMDEDGWVSFRGRLGEMIKTSGGTNVTPSEVEAALASCPEVTEAYVTGVPDGEEGQKVAAAVVLAAGSTLSAADLTTHLRSRLSAYKIPKIIWLAQKSELPFTDTGKVRKAELADLIQKRSLGD